MVEYGSAGVVESVLRLLSSDSPTFDLQTFDVCRFSSHVFHRAGLYMKECLCPFQTRVLSGTLARFS